MSSLSVSNTISSGYQQLSSVMAKRNADQAEQMAQSLRKQADVAQAQADKYEVKAQTLDSQANKAKVDADTAQLRFNLASTFKQAGNQLVNTMNHAVVKQSTYSSQETSAASNMISDKQVVGVNLDIVA